MAIVLTSLNRVLELPLSIKHVRMGESIVATNAPGGRLFVDSSQKGDKLLKDLSLEDKEEGKEVISLPLIEDYQITKETEEWDFASKLKMVDELENKHNNEG